MLPAHVPQLYDRTILARLEGLFFEDEQRTSRHRFRSAQDFVPRLAYFFCLLESGEYGHKLAIHALPWASQEYVLVMLRPTPNPPINLFSNIRRLRPRFFCINDDLGAAGPDHPGLESLQSFLKELFPTPSPWEKIHRCSPAPKTGLLPEKTNGSSLESPKTGNSE